MNLRDCVYGQRLITREGEVYRYITVLSIDATYPHHARGVEWSNTESYTNNGRFYISDDKSNHRDIVQVVPFDEEDTEWLLAEQVKKIWGVK